MKESGFYFPPKQTNLGKFDRAPILESIDKNAEVQAFSSGSGKLPDLPGMNASSSLQQNNTAKSQPLPQLSFYQNHKWKIWIGGGAIGVLTLYLILK